MPGNSDVRALAIAPATSSTLYAGMGEGSGLGAAYKSSDSGANCSAINSGLSNSFVYTGDAEMQPRSRSRSKILRGVFFSLVFTDERDYGCGGE